MATKMIKFDLLLKGVKVTNFDELQDNFGADILPIFQSGRLAKFLKSRELPEQADAITAIDLGNTELQQLAAICRVLELDDNEDVLRCLLDERQTVAATTQTTQAPQKKELSTLTGVDWSGQDMSKRQFFGKDLRNANLKSTDFGGSDFSGANLSGANLTSANLNGVLLNKTNFTGANLNNAIIINSGVSHSLKRIILDEFNKINISVFFKDSKISRVSTLAISSALTTDVNFSNANLTSANLDLCAFKSANFTGANLTKASIKQAYLPDANFTKADLSFADLTGTTFGEKVNFTDAKLTGVVGLVRPEGC